MIDTIEKDQIYISSIQWDLIEQIDSLRRILDPQEDERALRYRQPEDFKRFVIGRGLLRLQLGRLLRLPPREIQFEYNKLEKPALATDQNKIQVQFNLSHSGKFILIALCLGRRIGVDVECIRDLSDFDSMSNYIGESAEIEYLRACSSEARMSAFFSIWCRKESLIKAEGSGMKIPLPSFRVLDNHSTKKGQLELVVHTFPGQWSLHHFEPAPNYMAAVAYEGERAKIEVGSMYSL